MFGLFCFVLLFGFFVCFFFQGSIFCIVPLLTTRHKGIGFWIHHGDGHSAFHFQLVSKKKNKEKEVKRQFQRMKSRFWFSWQAFSLGWREEIVYYDFFLFSISFDVIETEADVRLTFVAFTSSSFFCVANAWPNVSLCLSLFRPLSA
jgi:hypothetical protein